MSSSPRVSLALPVYNGEEFLHQAIDSLLQQTFDDFELIVSDNASTDRTAEICAEYAARDSRIRYYRNSENIGVDRNYNRSFQLAQGEYFRWNAADDVSAPELLERCVQTLDSDPGVVLCYPKSRYVDENFNLIRDYEDRLNLDVDAPSTRFAAYLRNVEMCNAAFGLMRSNVLRQTGLCGTYSDSDFVLLGELLLYGKFVELPQRLFFRRIHAGIAVRKYPTAQARMEMSDPGSTGRLSFPHWKVIAGYLGAIHRAPLTFSQRLRCYFHTHIWMRRRRHDLKMDLKFAGRYLLAKFRPKKMNEAPGGGR